MDICFAKSVFAVASFDQTFPGWHELTTCYKNSGWRVVERIHREWTNPDNSEEKWPYIEVHMDKPTGEEGLLVFSLFDGFGVPFDAPKNWGVIPHIFHGISNRLGSRVRARLFQGEAYQTQVFVQGFGKISGEIRDEVASHYLEVREVMRDEFIAAKKRRQNGGSAEPESTSNVDEVAKLN